MARGVIAGLFQAAYVYTPEVYPTSLRSVGVGGCSALARLGAMATPYVAQVCLDYRYTDESGLEYGKCSFISRFSFNHLCGVLYQCMVFLQCVLV